MHRKISANKHETTHQLYLLMKCKVKLNLDTPFHLLGWQNLVFIRLHRNGVPRNDSVSRTVSLHGGKYLAKLCISPGNLAIFLDEIHPEIELHKYKVLMIGFFLKSRHCLPYQSIGIILNSLSNRSAE